MKKISKISNKHILIFIIIIILIITSITTLIPSLARFANRHTIVNTDAWDGTIATKFKNGDGSVTSPFIISNGSELAYLEQTLETMDYSGYYFELTKDIVLNKGIFNYSEEDGITYVIDDITYYIEEYTNIIYEDKERTKVFDQGPHVKKFNPFNSLENFKGNFNGNSFSIKGLYISNDNIEVAMFTNLKGNVSNLYLDNAMIYGGQTTAALASTASNSNITNIMTSGNVISSDLCEYTKTNIINDITVETFENTAHNLIDLTNYIPFIKSTINKIELTGSYAIEGNTNTIVNIDNQVLNESNFMVDLTNSDLNRVYIDLSSEGNSSVKFKNLKLKINYDQQITGGLIGIANNTKVINTINKTNIKSNMYAGGLVGAVRNNIEVSNSYNTGNATSELAAGIISAIQSSENININKTYNTGVINGTQSAGFIADMDESTININNSFNTSINREITENDNPNINIINSYTTNEYSDFENIDLSNLQDKNFIINTLGFNQYVDSTESIDNAWIIESTSFPILFIDDSTKEIATIHAGKYSFNNFSDILSPIKYNDSIKFTIEVDDYYKDDTEVFYYVSDTVLTRGQLDTISNFIPYYGLVNIETTGVNIIYSKLVRTGINNEQIVNYINTDRLVISDALPNVKMNINKTEYSTLKVENLNTIYLDRPTSIKVEASSLIDDYLDIKYYLTNEIKMESQIQDLTNEEWLDYNNEIKIDEIGKYIIYVKVTDSSGEKVFINSDYVVLDGYIAKKTQCGTNNFLYENLNIGKKSKMYFNFTYESNLDNKQYKHYIKTNKNLPIGTTLSLIDNKTNKYYEYIVEDLEKEIAFTNFYEIGTVDNNLFYKEFNYYENNFIIENFEIVADFSTAVINGDIENIELSVIAKSDNYTRNTIYTTIKPFTIINEESTSYLTSEYNNDVINLNTPVTTNIQISTGINNKINRTELENKKLGLILKIFDSEGNSVDFNKVNNLYFKVGEKFYYPENDNSIRIPFEGNKMIIDTTLSITSINKNTKLENGEYILNIENYISDDGKYYSNKLGNSLNINLSVENTESLHNNVNIELNDESKIINTIKDKEEVIFEIENPKNLDIKVSLYKKDKLTAYNQDYSILDINSVLTKELTKYADNIYNIGIIEFNTTLLEKTGYKLSFLVYDNDKLIESIDKYFIVR